MRVLLLFVAVAGAAASVIKSPTRDYEDTDRFIDFPGDGDGIVHHVDTQEPVDEEFIRQYIRNPANNRFFLYTRDNPTSAHEIEMYNVDSVPYSYFNPSKATIFLAHGWNGDGGNGMNRMLTQALLENDDVNVIVLDWSRLANRGYTTAKNGVPDVGRGLGQFINWMVSAGLTTYDQVHLVGFSLGGHLVGSAGRETGARVQRITALDPAGPLWGRDRNRVVPTDAQYVEVIHTNTGLLGYTDPCGDADFYPNGGSSMPGCWTNSCDHGMANEYFASSVKYNHLLANQCETYRDATRNRCTGALEPMGNSDLNKHITGIFRVNTARRYPF